MLLAFKDTTNMESRTGVELGLSECVCLFVQFTKTKNKKTKNKQTQNNKKTTTTTTKQQQQPTNTNKQTNHPEIKKVMHMSYMDLCVTLGRAVLLI